MKIPLRVGLAFALSAACLSWLTLSVSKPPRPAASPVMPPAPPPTLARIVEDVLPRAWGVFAGKPDTLAKASQKDSAPRVVLVHAFDGKRRARSAGAAGTGLVDAVTRAVSGLAGRRPSVLRLDVLAEGPVRDVALDALIDVEALDEALSIGDRIVLLPDMIRAVMAPASGVATLEQVLVACGELDRALGLTPAARTTRSLPVRRMRDEAWTYDGQVVTPLVRGAPLAGLPLTVATLHQAARLGGDYLARSTDAAGKLVYLYHPTRAEPADYNIVRHAGTVWSMLELSAALPDPALMDAARRAVGYLVRAAVPCADPRLSWIVEDGRAKLGGSALAVVAIARYQELTGDRRHEAVMLSLGRYLLSQQEANGRFFPATRRAPDGAVLEPHSSYFPGESVLACLRLHRLTRDARWLDAARRGADWLVDVRDAGVPTAKLEHDHWLLYALRELHDVEPRANLARHAMRIAEAICADQLCDPANPDQLGMYSGKERSTPTATRSEGLVQAHHLAMKTAPERAPAILRALHLGLSLQLRTQHRPESAMFFSEPLRLIGGFAAAPARPEVRNDAVQHNVCALLGAARLMEDARLTALDRTSPAGRLLEERDARALGARR